MTTPCPDSPEAGTIYNEYGKGLKRRGGGVVDA